MLLLVVVRVFMLAEKRSSRLILKLEQDDFWDAKRVTV